MSGSHFFFFTITRSGRLVKISWSVCISKFQRILCISFSRTDSESCIYHLFVWLNLNFLHNSLWITFSTQSRLILYFLCTNLLHSFIMWLFIFSLSPHNLYLLFSCVLSIEIVLMELFCAVIRKYSVSLLRFPFLSHV